MFKTNSNKNALIMSIISLLLCASMFVSTTFAWFTDSVNAANNKIVAGSLQVDLELLEKDGSWTSIKESGEAIFDYSNWEPGYTDVKILRVVNEGTLALNWIAKFVADYELSALADVIDVYIKHNITAYPAQRKDVTDWEKVGTVAEFVNKSGTTANGSLEPGESDYLGVAFQMRETAGNEYKGMDLGGAFDIQIFATQYPYEKDSFDEKYDANAFSPLTNRVYFRSLRSALSTITDGTISDRSSDCGEHEASVSVTWENGQYVVILLDSVTENAPVEITKNLKLVLNGHSVTFSETNVGFSIPQGADDAVFGVDGQVPGSAIAISGGNRATAIQVNAGSCSIVGGCYTSTAVNAGTQNEPNPCIEVNNGATLSILGAEASASDTDKGTSCGIYVGENSFLNASNCDVLASSPYGLGVHGIHNLGSAVIADSSIKGYSNYTANKAGTAYASHSRGVFNSGAMKMTDCHVIGTHSGVVSQGELFIDGGTYEGYGHGGIYFTGPGTVSYVKDATVGQSQMPDGYYDDGVAGTNYAGMYIGGGSGRDSITVYMDNCDLYGEKQSAVIRGSSGEKENALYISNSRINTAAKIRIDKNNTLYIGSGNNFTAKNTRGYGTPIAIDESFRDIIDSFA